ncbi:MAG: preprotein translocase subunit SecE [Flavobacteriales bacterium]|nr:preprotein translocase subunit SecE [Flavobacteriales bacterium]
MKGVINFINDSFSEFRYNVEWPKWESLQQSTVVVVVTTVLLSIFLFIVDYLSRNSLEVVYKSLTNLFN